LLVASVNGIFRVKDGTFQQWSMDNGFPDNDVLWVIEDSNGTLWAGLSSGICRIIGRQIRKITTNDGLFDNYVFALVPDNHGSFWMNSSRGFFRVSRKSLNDFADGKADKVECTPFDGLEAVKAVDTTDVEYSGCKTLDGRIWFPGPQGIVMANPQNLISNPVAPPTHIQRVRANGLELLTETHPAVRPGRGELEIQYTAVSFIEPQKLRFRYRLEGYDTQWIDAGVRRSAFYTNLKPGKYRFRVQACNADGFWNTADESFELELPPQFYQTTWFETLCTLLGLVALTGLYVMGVRHLGVKQRRLQEINEMLESKVAERTRELAAQRNLLRTLIDHLPDNFFVKDTGGRVVLDNIAHARMIGVQDPEEAVGKTDFDRFSGDLAEKCRADEKRVLELGEVFNGEESLVNLQTGDQRWFQTTKVPLRDDQGKIVGLAGINRDITERRKTEEELRQKTALFEALVNSSLDGILVVGRQGQKILQNQQTVDLWKIPQEVVDQDSDEVQILHVMNMARDPEAFRQHMQHLTSHPDEMIRGELELKDGTVLDRYSAPIRSRDGTYYGRIWMFRDITERKRMELEMERTHNELLQASRQAGMAEVATSVLHNVGNVLNSVNVSASVVEDRIKKSSTENLVKVLTLLRQHEHDLAEFLARDEKGRQLIRYLEAFVQHLDAEKADLLQELKHLGRNIEHIKEIVAMQQTYARVAGVTVIIRVSELVEDALQMNALSYERHGVTLVREFSEVPVITADRHKIIQILLNLLQNAKHACSDAGSNTPRVVVRIDMAGPGRIRIEVGDNGIGIPPENLTRIFSHGFTTRKNGHGFGLHSGALAAREMGGVLSVRSDGPGNGATFALELPVEYKPRPAGPAPVSPIPSDAPGSSGR
jgi:PAS domain S-box-containing protein